MKEYELMGGNAHLVGLNNINLIMGRNGAGKSRFLRDIEQSLNGQKERFYVRYVSPERAGSFKRDGNVLTNMSSDPNWLRATRAVNQASNFKGASATLFQEAEKIYLRRLARTPTIRMDQSRNFETDRLSKINQLLTNIEMVMTDSDFEFRRLSDSKTIVPNDISSGESEAVALGAEIIYFFDTIDANKFNVLLIDEPDVHLHPDLQARLGKLIVNMLEEFEEHIENIAVCISTHSAPFVCSLVESKYVSIGTKSFDVDAVALKPTTDQLRKVAPFFGHPLSLSLSEDAALIVEGEDDERVWQQAARASQGKIRLFPVLAGSVNQQAELEKFCVNLLTTLYDDPVAFSLRDGDGIINVPLEHTLPLKRYRLACYAIENLLLTDPCLSIMRTSWEDFVEKAKKWITSNPNHADVGLLEDAINSDDRLRHKKIKNIRQLICSVLDCKKPWEVVVGQAIGALSRDGDTGSEMLVDFLGGAMVQDVILRQS